MKRFISVLLLFSLLSPSFLAAQQASLLGEEILSDLLTLNAQIESLQLQLEALQQNSIVSEQLLADLEESRQRRESLLQQLSELVDQQAKAYGASLRKWEFLTILFGSLSAALAGVVIYQGASN